MHPLRKIRLGPQGTKSLATLALVAILSACSNTPDIVKSAPVINTTPINVIDQNCMVQATGLSTAAATSGATAQFLSAARYMQSCLMQPLPVPLDKNQSQSVMQLMANATLNFIQGGDIAAAQQQLREFSQQFPQQDLYLPNFSSFLDTSTALLQGANMTTSQLAELNISRELREEVQRQQYWLSH